MEIDLMEIILVVAVALGFGMLFKKEKHNEEETRKLKEEVAGHRTAIQSGTRRLESMKEEAATKKEEIHEDISDLGASDVADRYRQRRTPDYDQDLR